MLENKDILFIILSVTLVATVLFFNFSTKRLSTLYRARIDMEKLVSDKWKSDFDSLLKDKKIESVRRKEAEQQVRELADKVEELEEKSPTAADMNLPLNISRKILEQVGRIGMLQGDIWTSYNTQSYVTCTVKYLQAVSEKILPMTQSMYPETYNIEKVKRIQGILTNLNKEIIEQTTIIPTLVEEMFAMTDNFFRDRERYLLSGGPEPMARIEVSFSQGKVIQPLIEEIVNKYPLEENQKQMMVTHIVNLLLYPLLHMQQQINTNVTENTLFSTGYLVTEITDVYSGIFVNFIIPSISRLNLERNHKFKLDDILK